MDDMVFNILKDITGEDLSGRLDENLFEDGRLDSLGVLQLILSVEQQAGIHLDPSMVNRADIETPGKMIQYLSGVKLTFS